jgi:branched-chain amino acid transport system substrate-binding protein
MITRRSFLQSSATAAAFAASAGSARADNAPGVTDTEIKIGQTMPYSGPASAYGVIGKADLAYFKMINEQGGVNGRKINLISLDDGYSPPRPSSRRAASWSRSRSPFCSTASAQHVARLCGST